jgi:hypothetical protein
MRGNLHKPWVWQSGAGLPEFSWHNMPNRAKMYQIVTKLPHRHKMSQIYSKWQQNIPNFCIPKLTQIEIFGFKIYHLWPGVILLTFLQSAIWMSTLERWAPSRCPSINCCIVEKISTQLCFVTLKNTQKGEKLGTKIVPTRMAITRQEPWNSLWIGLSASGLRHAAVLASWI